ncbi:lantibiotic dehydratase C-terminal domain-containing protein [Arthrobacter pigmenti]
MTQVATVREDTGTLGSPLWWTVSIYTGDLAVADAVVGELVAPLAAQARVLGVERWFYTRSTDQMGPHIKVRFLGSRRTLERLQRFQSALRGRLTPRLARLDIEQQYVAGINRQHYMGAPTGELDGRHEAELAKYGGVEALQLAQEVFELSSDLAVWASQRFNKSQNRSAMASLLLSDSARAMLRGPRSGQWPDRRRLSWDYYWDSHLKWRTADLGQNGPRARAAMVEQVSTKVQPMHCLMAATASDAAVQTWRRRWSGSIDNYLYRADKARASRSAQHLTLHQAQMMLNRLGFTPREEAALGLYARTWTQETEAQLVEVRR